MATRCSSNPLRCSGTSRPGTRVFAFRLEAFDAFLGIREGLHGSAAFAPHNAPGNTSIARNNEIICLQETFGKDEFLQAVQVQYTQFWLFGTFTLNSVHAGGSAIFIHKNLLPDGAIVNHVTTCQGRDHVVTTRSGEGVLVAVNVHVEPDLVLRNLRERLHRISLHWPR